MLRMKGFGQIVWVIIVLLCLALMLGYLVLWDGLIMTAMVGGAILALAMVKMVGRNSLWRAALIGLLSGYIVLSRGFAYISLPVDLQWMGLPVQLNLFVGEVVLIFCLLAMPHRSVYRGYLGMPGVWLLLGWMGLGLVRMIVGLPTHGVTAVRDAAMFYYAAFTYVGYAFAGRDGEVPRMVRSLGLAFLVLLVYSVARMSGLTETLPESLMALGSDVPLIATRRDATAVQLAAGFLFCLLIAREYRYPGWLRWGCGLAQFMAFGFLGVRAAFVGLIGALASMVWLRQVRSALRILLGILLCAALLGGWGVEVELGGRVFSPGRAVELAKSIVDVSGNLRYRYPETMTSVSNTDWRLEYWRSIASESIRSPLRLLFGRGFGPDLAPSAKFIGEDPDRPNRNPHNIIMTIYARMGIVGVAAWVAFHIWLFMRVRSSLWRARQKGDIGREKLLTFMTAYTVLIVVAALFAVLLESPFMAIPYYFFVGVLLQLAGGDGASVSNRAESLAPEETGTFARGV